MGGEVNVCAAEVEEGQESEPSRPARRSARRAEPGAQDAQPTAHDTCLAEEVTLRRKSPAGERVEAVRRDPTRTATLASSTELSMS